VSHITVVLHLGLGRRQFRQNTSKATVKHAFSHTKQRRLNSTTTQNFTTYCSYPRRSQKSNHSRTQSRKTPSYVSTYSSHLIPSPATTSDGLFLEVRLHLYDDRDAVNVDEASLSSGATANWIIAIVQNGKDRASQPDNKIGVNNGPEWEQAKEGCHHRVAVASKRVTACHRPGVALADWRGAWRRVSTIAPSHGGS